jgi:replication factor C small subunit
MVLKNDAADSHENRRLSLLWVQKYRLESFKGIVDQSIVKEQLQRIVASKNLPNLLFSGPAGTGKSSVAEVVARELFGEVWEGNFTEINASDIFEQGRRYLEASRSLARFYDERKGVLDNFKLIMNRLAGIAPLAAPYRILFMNDADALTLDAQQALRRTIEKYSRTCKFVLATTRPSQIITPVRSRCVLLHFRQLDVKATAAYLQRIASEEGRDIPDEQCLAVARLSAGNLRRAMTLAQIVTESDISDAELEILSNRAKPREIAELMQLASQNDVYKAIRVLDRLLLEIGLSGSEILAQLRAYVRAMPLPKETLALLLVILSNADRARLEALNERIQLEALICAISDTFLRAPTSSN